MPRYLFIESRDPYDSADSEHFATLVQGSAARGNEATLFLVQNGVLAARKGAQLNERLKQLQEAKVKVVADGFSLRERAINEVVEGVEVGDMNTFVNLLLQPNTKAVWH